MTLVGCPNCGSTSWEQEQDDVVLIWRCTINADGTVNIEGSPQIEGAPETYGYRCRQCRKFFYSSAAELAGVEPDEDA